MKYELFEKMTQKEAVAYLDEFLEFGKNRALDLLGSQLHFTVDLDFSLKSLVPILKASLPFLRTLRREPDPTVPEFIRSTDDYEKGLFAFDEHSKLMILASAYYLGETFCGNFPLLEWTTGDIEFHQGKMPVVTGFRKHLEMPPILVVENLYGRFFAEGRDDDSITNAIDFWLRIAP